MIKKKHIILSIAIALVAILVIAFVMNKDKGSILSARERGIMTEYLEKKYGQEFVVENMRVTGVGIGSQGSWRGDAYPKSDPSLRFEVRMPQGTSKIDFETFLQVLWSRQGAAEVEEFLSKEFPDNAGYVLRISPGNSPGGAWYDSIQGTTPSLNDVMKDRKDQIAYSLSVRNVVDVSTEEPSGAQLKNALKVVNFVKAKATSPAVYAYYIYRDASFGKKDKDGQQGYQYSFALERDQFNSVNTATDLTQYFKALDR